MPDRSSPLPAEAAAAVREWLGEEWTAHPLAGDASVRAYFRISRPDGTSYMLAYYPEEVRPQLKRALDAYAAVAKHGRVPPILQSCAFATLQHDVGDRTLFDLLHEDRFEGLRLYRKAVDLLVEFQRAPAGQINPPFTSQFFFNELEMTREYYVEKLMGASSDDLAPVLKRLCDKVASHPYALCHRDFHGQNIHIVNHELFLIDYQDLRMGPDTYDLASLLRDRGVARIIGDEAELELLAYYGERSDADAGIRRRYFETLLQRSIKILGTFAKQPIARGRMHYLEFIPPTIDSIRRCLEELPELSTIARRFPLDFSPEKAAKRARQLKEY